MRIPATNSKPATPETSAPAPARRRLPAWLPALLLALATIILYWPATHHDFVNYDDNDYVTKNLHVQAGLTLENLTWAFSNPVSANWHPLTVLSHMLDCQLYGLKPWGHHLTSILLHTVNTMLVFLRKQPNEDSPIVDRLMSGQTIKVTEKKITGLSRRRRIYLKPSWRHQPRLV